MIAQLLRQLPVTVSEDLVKEGKFPDTLYVERVERIFSLSPAGGEGLGEGALHGNYVGTRSPNGHPEGAPFEHYGRLQSSEAVRYASEVIEFVRAQMAKP